MNNISVGTYGYDHRQWQDGFYDAELPPDWRFLHYCNQFRAILLPFDSTSDLLSGSLPELVEDSDDDFRFFLEVGDLADIEHLLEGLTPLAARITGVVVRLRALPESRWRAGGFAVRLVDLDRLWPVSLDLADLDTEMAEEAVLLARRHRLSLVWRPGSEPEPRVWGRLLVARLADPPLPEIRRVLAMAAAMQSDTCAGIFFDQPRTAPELAIKCRVMAELMGL